MEILELSMRTKYPSHLRRETPGSDIFIARHIKRGAMLPFYVFYKLSCHLISKLLLKLLMGNHILSSPHQACKTHDSLSETTV